MQLLGKLATAVQELEVSHYAEFLLGWLWGIRTDMKGSGLIKGLELKGCQKSICF